MLPITGDGHRYAKAIAQVVFGMDTRGTGDYKGLLLTEADPS